VSTLTATTFPKWAQLSIVGGPVSITIAPVPMAEVAAALGTGDAAALYAIDSEYAPFSCPDCTASYCREHYRRYEVYDDGFLDCINGICPQGHKRMLAD
jgi:hypothetical protein